MIVVQFGGHAMKDENGNFAKAISAALATGEKVVVVHGGGPQIDAALKAIRETLDHRLLNEIEELGIPTLENLARYIYTRAKAALPEVVRVKLRRPSYNQTCVYGS